MKELLEQINAQYEAFQSDAGALLESGNKSAGTRARKATLEMTKLMKDFRKLSIEASKK
ncbi:histone H1 [Formosa algae]|uniref:histone H1 n=1 Tax=Formosa algae TaxID=225843 RepID=UPI000CCFC77F|nr:histone H1 [Formosa algae]PNW27308.1 histone H1 [Formosa algae]